MNKNIDQNEVNKFAELADKWWDSSGEFKPLHNINPIRSEYIASKIDLKGKTGRRLYADWEIPTEEF